MNDEQHESDSVPGSGAGDAATSQAIPHLPKPVTNPPRTSSAGGTPTAKKKPGLKQSPAPTVVPAETDKGRAREIATAEAKIAPTKAEKPRRIEPVPPTRPLTAADYARTTTPSPATTSVIPAVKEEPMATEATPAPYAPSTRQASLRLNHIEPWSVARIAFAVSVAMMIVGVVAMTIFWVVLNIAGVWDQVNEAVTSVLSDDSSSFDITDYLGFGRLIGLTLVLSAINVVLMTALATIGAHLYNLAAQVLGGVEVTFSEEN
ncbi:DUF3566 domain-containing protein [Aeromicrobium sp.]|uniref:DUF3566 domain-containing protein n=1 Tax=Aeromicrobium sp. TaxID=1871063 RepID=UPI002FCC4B98